MKRVVVFSLVVLLAGTGVYGSDKTFAPIPDSRVVAQGEIVKIIYESATPRDVRISILDNQRNELFAEKIRGLSGFLRPYNFSELEDGTYLIKVDDGAIEYTREVEYAGPDSSSPDDFLAHVHKLDTQKGDCRYLLTVPDGDPIEISITDNRGNVLYNHKEVLSGDFASLYRIDNQSGEIGFQVKDGKGRLKSFNFGE